MTNEKLLQVLDFYSNLFSGWVNEAERCEGDETSTPHLYWMVKESKKFIKLDEIDKAHRWLGFVQGVLFCKGEFTIEELRFHNRS